MYFSWPFPSHRSAVLIPWHTCRKQTYKPHITFLSVQVTCGAFLWFLLFLIIQFPAHWSKTRNNQNSSSNFTTSIPDSGTPYCTAPIYLLVAHSPSGVCLTWPSTPSSSSRPAPAELPTLPQALCCPPEIHKKRSSFCVFPVLTATWNSSSSSLASWAAFFHSPAFNFQYLKLIE